jgi:hypothetical protein
LMLVDLRTPIELTSLEILIPAPCDLPVNIKDDHH